MSIIGRACGPIFGMLAYLTSEEPVPTTKRIFCAPGLGPCTGTLQTMTTSAHDAGKFNRMVILGGLTLMLTGCASTRPTPDAEPAFRAWSSPVTRSSSSSRDNRTTRDDRSDANVPYERAESGGNAAEFTASDRENRYDLARKSALLTSVNRWLGTPYRYGGSGPSGVDCSAFVQSVYAEALGLKLPRTTEQQRDSGTQIDASRIGFGDLVFFQISRSQGHVGVVVGPDEFAHASSSSGVTVSRLDDPYWSARFDRAVRFDPGLAVFAQARVDNAPRRPARTGGTPPPNPDSRPERATGSRTGW